jgi:hypothetical protein
MQNYLCKSCGKRFSEHGNHVCPVSLPAFADGGITFISLFTQQLQVQFCLFFSSSRVNGFEVSTDLLAVFVGHVGDTVSDPVNFLLKIEQTQTR